MSETPENPSEQALAALLQPLARMMIDAGIPLPGAVEILKKAFVSEALRRDPDASASHISLTTGVHRKDIRRLEAGQPATSREMSAARVISLWLNDPDFAEAGQPRVLTRDDLTGFDALVRRAKVDSAPSTLLSVLADSGCVRIDEDRITLISATLVPADHAGKLKAAVATLRPHLDTAAGNLAGDPAQWDQALRYSHLSEEAARDLEAEAGRLALEMLQRLNEMAHRLQEEDEGAHLFVAGTFTRVEDQG